MKPSLDTTERNNNKINTLKSQSKGWATGAPGQGKEGEKKALFLSEQKHSTTPINFIQAKKNELNPLIKNFNQLSHHAHMPEHQANRRAPEQSRSMTVSFLSRPAQQL